MLGQRAHWPTAGERLHPVRRLTTRLSNHIRGVLKAWCRGRSLAFVFIRREFRLDWQSGRRNLLILHEGVANAVIDKCTTQLIELDQALRCIGCNDRMLIRYSF
jgi:hypothetical protein